MDTGGVLGRVIEWPTQIVIEGEIIVWIVACILLTPFVAALAYDAQSRRWVWLFFDLLVPPLGVARGVCIWFRWL